MGGFLIPRYAGFGQPEHETRLGAMYAKGPQMFNGPSAASI